jgi:hypothetical protein
MSKKDVVVVASRLLSVLLTIWALAAISGSTRDRLFIFALRQSETNHVDLY